MILNIATKRGAFPTKLGEAEIMEFDGIKVVIHEELDPLDMENIRFDATHYNSGMNIPKCNRKTKSGCKNAVRLVLSKAIKSGYNFDKYSTINN